MVTLGAELASLGQAQSVTSLGVVKEVKRTPEVYAADSDEKLLKRVLRKLPFSQVLNVGLTNWYLTAHEQSRYCH